MWCFPCLKPSTKDDPPEDHFGPDSWHGGRKPEDRQLAWALEESFNQQKSPHPREEEERRRIREVEDDSQFAHGLQNEESGRQMDNKSALEYDEEQQVAKAVEESLKMEEKRKQSEEQVKKDEQLARIVQERLNTVESPPLHAESRRVSLRAPLDEDQQVAKAVKESLKEEEKRKQSEEQVKKDEQLARIVQENQNTVESPPLRSESRRVSLRAPLDEDQQVAKAVKESLKEEKKRKQSEEQVKKDEQLARIVQENLNTVESPPLRSESRHVSLRAPLDEDQQIPKALEESLKERGKGKQSKDEQVKKDEQFAVVLQESLNTVDSPPRLAENETISTRPPLDEYVQLAKAIEESLKDKGKGKQPEDEVEDDDKLPEENPPRSMCGGCNIEIEHGKSVDVLGVLWHPDCLWCDACHKQITIHGIENLVSNSRGNFHKACYARYCYVCKAKVKFKMFNQHPFWKENYCPAHESDKTPKCCSCERLEPKGANYVILGDKRQLCLECMESAVMDTDEVQPLHFEIREYFEGLHLKIEKEFPFLLVEKQALNQAEKKENIKDNQYEVVTRGICLSEAQTIRVVAERLKMEPNKQLVDIRTEPQEVVRTCEVTAVLILYGLPRVMTGYILAHEMMHAYLRLNGHKIKNNVMEEGICQVLGHMWLESQIYAPVEAEASSSASVSHIPVAAACASKKGKCSDFERKLVEFCKNQIETDESPIYGVGFKRVNQMVVSDDYNLKETLKKIITRKS